MSDPIELDTGALTPAQVRLVLDAIPADLTFVDEARKVRFYNESCRIFKRTPEVIGSDVVACHSPASQPRVARLMSELESGWRDEAEFLSENDGRWVKIRYIAVRDGDGTYRGCLEMVQYTEDLCDPVETPSPPE